MEKITILFLAFLVTIASAQVAVFPVRSINTDQSYSDAMGAILAQKYAAESKLQVKSPFESSKALGSDTNYSEAAKKLGVAEYITVEAVGLFLSRKEKYEVENSGTGNKQQIIVQVNENSEDNDEDEENAKADQELLDKNKTIVTATRYSVDGKEIYRSQMTLVTYGDIEESSDRFAKSLYRKVTPENVINESNITRREGMGKNTKYMEKLKGVRVGFLQPFDFEDGTLVPNITIGYNMKIEVEKFFVEFGVGPMLPSSFSGDKRGYGGVYFDLGVSKIFNSQKGVMLPFIGGGVNPFVNFMANRGTGNGMEMGIAPFVSAGFLSSRLYKTRFYCDIRIGQNILPVSTYEKVVDEINSIYYTEYKYIKHTDYPFEMGLQFGIAW